MGSGRSLCTTRLHNQNTGVFVAGDNFTPSALCNQFSPTCSTISVPEYSQISFHKLSTFHHSASFILRFLGNVLYFCQLGNFQLPTGHFSPVSLGNFHLIICRRKTRITHQEGTVHHRTGDRPWLVFSQLSCLLLNKVSQGATGAREKAENVKTRCRLQMASQTSVTTDKHAGPTHFLFLSQI